MELTTLTHTAPVAAIAARLGRAFSNASGTLVRAIRRRRERLRIESELAGMRDRELADLGLSRHDIPRFAREAAAPN